MSTPDITQLTESQQTALQDYTDVTDQEPGAAIPLLQRSEWNVQIAISRFFDGEPTTDLLAEAQQNASLPPPSARQTTNLQYEALLAAHNAPSRRISSEDVVRRIDTSAGLTPAYRPPFLLSMLFTPINLLYRLFGAVLSPLSFLVPTFVTRVLRNLFTFESRPSRRVLPPADTARRFIREFEETYAPNPPLPFVESGFNLALENSKKDGNFLLVVLLSPSHDDTHSWVRGTLMSSQLHQFLQVHQHEMTLWAGSVQDTEGYQVASSLNCTKFPFVALICQATENIAGSTRAGDMTVIMRAVGPMPADELLAKLNAAMTAQQSQLAAIRAQRSEQQAERNLRQEQDSAYERSLAQDRERTRRRREEEQARLLAEQQAQKAAEEEQRHREMKESWKLWRKAQLPGEPDESVKGIVRLSIRMPNGERLVRKFAPSASIDDLYAFVECHDVSDASMEKNDISSPPSGYKHDYKFRLVSPMPRDVLEPDSRGTISSRVGRGGNLIVEELDDSTTMVEGDE